MKFNHTDFFEYKDMFNYYNLITKINKWYKLYFNNKEKCFCVVNSAKNNQICLIFNHFNKNILNNLQFTKIENAKFLFNSIEKHNENLSNKKLNNSIDYYKTLLNDYSNFIQKKSLLSK